MRYPDRINLSIGHTCSVSCPGCYSFFGVAPAQLAAVATSVSEFVAMGVDSVTISGGDPLLVKGLGAFIETIRRAGVRMVKVDTVGTPLVEPASSGQSRLSLRELLSWVDVLAIPLDGWSNESVCLFRRGRPHLFYETRQLMRMLDAGTGEARVFINTVAHRFNVGHLSKIWQIVVQHRAVTHWNVFQYTATDQVSRRINEWFEVTDQEFTAARDGLLAEVETSPRQVEFASNRERLGRYLLVNSDGEAWLPDPAGRTVRLGSVFRREREVLHAWSDAVDRLMAESDVCGIGGTLESRLSEDAGLPGLRSR